MGLRRMRRGRRDNRDAFNEAVWCEKCMNVDMSLEKPRAEVGNEQSGCKSGAQTINGKVERSSRMIDGLILEFDGWLERLRLGSRERREGSAS
jgi:hypothetical protein